MYQKKEAVRSRLRKRLQTFSSQEIAKKSNLIFENLCTSGLLESGEAIGVYCAQSYEVQTIQLIEYLFLQGKRVCAPVVTENSLVFREIQSLADLQPGFKGISEPLLTAPIVTSIDVLIIPCIGVDEIGNRLGSGMGFYDRFFCKNSIGSKICIIFEAQVTRKLPSQPHDVPVDVIITESRVILTKKNKISKLINGNKAANLLLQRNRFLVRKNKVSITLAVILVGQHQPSLIYVKKKLAACSFVGIATELYDLPEESEATVLFSLLDRLNQSARITGILMQLPLPSHLQQDTEALLNSISPDKDIDGLGNNQKKRLLSGSEELAPCTPKGILRLLESLNTPLKGKIICLVGHGFLVNQPLEILLKNRAIMPLICTKATADLATVTKQADIIVSATGVPHLLNASHIKDGCIVIDAGSGEINGKICGDCDTVNMLEKVRYITPVPGGVGPLTIASLTENLLHAWKLQNTNKKLENSIATIAVLTSPQSWFLPYAQEFITLLQRNFKAELYTNHEHVPASCDVVFVLSYFEALPQEFIDCHGVCLIAHESNSPTTWGWAPLFWQILKNKKTIFASLLLATTDKSSGDIVITEKIPISGLELHNELRQKQAQTITRLCCRFLEKFPTRLFLKTTKQIGGASIYRRRTPLDSEIDINKPLRTQINQLRIASNKDFPAFFYYKGKKFIIKISHANETNNPNEIA